MALGDVGNISPWVSSVGAYAIRLAVETSADLSG
ncbi:hypothetical protein PENNAL_c0801G03975 [Penicillium nalgiovense]|uniref:Uncharacterized protein n=1 Tax=Penicillium nalgiovense TaxID=60175 RepID=A0A1V6UF44_PENNA|nr:hypothetical protein PENNAL_c0801G03975 [Penicillium nalgiovense]